MATNLLTNCQNSFTVALKNKFAIMLLLKIPAFGRCYLQDSDTLEDVVNSLMVVLAVYC